MVTELQSPSPYVTELTAQLESLKHQNRCKCLLSFSFLYAIFFNGYFNFFFYFCSALKDSYDELQASSIAKGIERGRLLLTESPSLASELDGLTHDDVSILYYYYLIYNLVLTEFQN